MIAELFGESIPGAGEQFVEAASGEPQRFPGSRHRIVFEVMKVNGQTFLVRETVQGGLERGKTFSSSQFLFRSHG